MRAVISCLIVSWLVGAASISHAEPRKKFVISLGVLPERAPDRLCVLTPVTCGVSGHNCSNTAPVGVIASFAGLESAGLYRFRHHLLDGDPASEAPLKDIKDIQEALRSLIRPLSETRLCNHEDYGACTPELDLRKSGTTDSGPGQIVCSTSRGEQKPGSGPDGSGSGFASKRVALIALQFTEAVQDGVKAVSLDGVTATVVFKNPTSTEVIVQVVGGDYAVSEQSTFKIEQTASVPLKPRCSHFVAEVPSYAGPIKSIAFDRGPRPGTVGRDHPRMRGVTHQFGAALRALVELFDPGPARDRVTCVPEDPEARLIPIELPFTPAGADKRLTVTYATDPPTKSEVQWSESAPPTPLRLGVRSIHFSWQRPIGCLAERWSEPVPEAVARSRTWSKSCPRVTVANSTICTVRRPRSNEDVDDPRRCEYRCAIDEHLPALTLPIPVVFDRVRARPAEQPEVQHRLPPEPEVLYSWRDQLEYSGQELRSVVAPADRRVILEFPYPSAWKDSFGDEIDAIRVLGGQSSTQLDLLERDRTEVPPNWVSLPTQGRTCSDRVRIAIVGTRRYDEAAIEVKDGRVELVRPDDYRQHLSLYGLVGGGEQIRHLTSNARSATFGELGLGVQIDLPGPFWWPWFLGRSWSVDVELTGQLTHTFYQGIELPNRQDADFTAVRYLRFDLRGGLEWWFSRRLGGAITLGLGLGTPLESDDARLVGANRWSGLIEVQPILFTMFPRRLWLLSGAGCRVLEQHMDYHTYFTGSPMPNPERDTQCYLFLRFRAALE